jgi:hypothetical protein
LPGVEQSGDSELQYIPQLLTIALRYNAESLLGIPNLLEIARRAADAGQYGDALTVLQYAISNPHIMSEYGVSTFASWFTEEAPGTDNRSLRMHVFLWEEVAYALKELMKREVTPPLIADKIYVVVLIQRDVVVQKAFDTCSMYVYTRPRIGGTASSTGLWHRWSCPEYVRLGALKAIELKEKNLMPPPEKLLPTTQEEEEKISKEIEETMSTISRIEQLIDRLKQEYELEEEEEGEEEEEVEVEEEEEE